jgi:hypothetical protein
MNDSRVFSSETANDAGTYIFVSARLQEGASNGQVSAAAAHDRIGRRRLQTC